MSEKSENMFNYTSGAPARARIRIINACNNNWEENKSKCNSFVVAVANELGLLGLEGTANQIYYQIQEAPWKVIEPGEREHWFNAALCVVNYGYLVIAASHNPHPQGHGHVAIITGYSGFKALAYWGKLPPWGKPLDIGKKNEVITKSWNPKDFQQNVIYAYLSLPSSDPVRIERAVATKFQYHAESWCQQNSRRFR